MSRTSRTLAAALALLGVATLAAACGGSGGGGGGTAAPRCSPTYFTAVTWSTGVYGYGWYGAGGTVMYGDPGYGWYDPVDTSTPDDGTWTDDGTEDAPGEDDTAAGDDTSGDVGEEALRTPTAIRDARGCSTCAMGCIAGSSGREAVGISAVSHADACAGAVKALEGWAHRKEHARVDRCVELPEPGADSGAEHTPATPTVK